MTQFTNNKDGSVVTAYVVNKSILTDENNYAITLNEASKIVGLYPDQTMERIPVSGDYYIDNGDIASSSVMNSTEFLTSYTAVV